MVAEPVPVYGSRSIRLRRSEAEIQAIRDAIYQFAEQYHPVSVRQTFYYCETCGLVEKTEAQYAGTIGRLMREMRRAGELSYGWVADATRWNHNRPSYSSFEEALASAATAYRRAVWDSQDVLVQVWIEKEALASTVLQETNPYDVDLYVVKGFSSMSLTHGAADDMKASGKPVHVYYFGNHDPSGQDIARAVEKDLRGFGLGDLLTFELVAVSEAQIERLRLPTRPAKGKDTRSKKWGNKPCVDLDAIRPDILRGMVRDCIERHVDFRRLESLKLVEAEEREKFGRLVRGEVRKGGVTDDDR